MRNWLWIPISALLWSGALWSAPPGRVELTYEITRNWGAACGVSYETRDVTGALSFSYDAKTISCSTQFTWR